MVTALLFPGQGSQTAGMRELVARHRPDLLELAVAEAGADPFARADHGTAFAQPAIVCASLAAWEAAGRPAAGHVAGHSLGELSALAAAGAIDPADAVRLAAARGRAMQDAAREHPGAMVALLGAASDSRALARECEVEIANDNGPTQLVAAGSLAAIERLLAAAKQRGMRAIRLAIAGPFHTRAMEAAVPRYREALARVEIREPAVAVHSSFTARPFGGGAGAIRDQLAAAVTGRVRWRETLESLRGRGVGEFVEVGPGRALTNTVKRTLEGVQARTLELWETARG